MKEDIMQLKKRLTEERPASWEELPDIPLYMDQVLTLMNRQTIRFDEEDKLTSAMVNNYIKDGVAPRAEGKRYNAAHLAHLTMIRVLKQVLPVKDVALLTGSAAEVESSYERFCADLSSALNSAADQISDSFEEDDLADIAMRFSLLSYAYGLAGRRMTELLRGETPSKKAPKDKAHKKERKKKSERDGGNGQ